MKRKTDLRQRPLFTDWPTQHELPTEVQQQVEMLLANMYHEIVHPTQPFDDQEQDHEPTN